MLCPKCNQEIPDESKFCPYCGGDTSVPANEPAISQEPAAFQAPSISPYETAAAQVSAVSQSPVSPEIPPLNNADNIVAADSSVGGFKSSAAAPTAAAVCEKAPPESNPYQGGIPQQQFGSDIEKKLKSSKRFGIVTLIVSIVLVVGLIGLNVFQYISAKDKDETIESYQAENESLYSRLHDSEQELRDLQADYDELKEIADDAVELNELFEDAIVFVDYYGVYHHYGCYWCDDILSAMDIGTAIAVDCTPCSYCN